MINIYEASLLDLLPPNLKSDPDIISAAKSVDNDFLLAVNEVKQCVLLPNIDNLNDDVLDILAWQMHVDFYDQALPIEKKRALVKNSLKWHKQKGTPAAVEGVVTAAFDESTIDEWFEYNGDPYKFKITTTDRIPSTDKLNNLIKAVNSVKNARSLLEIINIQRGNERSLITATVNRQSNKTSLSPQFLPENMAKDANVYIASVSRQTYKITIAMEV